MRPWAVRSVNWRRRRGMSSRWLGRDMWRASCSSSRAPPSRSCTLKRSGPRRAARTPPRACRFSSEVSAGAGSTAGRRLCSRDTRPRTESPGSSLRGPWRRAPGSPARRRSPRTRGSASSATRALAPIHSMANLSPGSSAALPTPLTAMASLANVMAAADPANEATTHFLRDQFHRYYDTMKPTLPDRFGRREFGFMFWTPGIVQRHLGFSKEEELKAFLASRVPTHAYYSSAYYDNPNAPTMEEKGWLGADLIFDLDADHLPNAAKMSYPEMLEAIRLKIIHLYDDFLRSDFGFEEKAMRLVFSGGRGYHIHVFDERVWSLGSHERREIVDYVTGKGLEVGSVFRESAFDRKYFQGHTRVKTRLVAPTKEDPGWRGKIMRGINSLAGKLEALPPDEAIKFLASFEGVSESDAANLYENLFKPRATKDRKSVV